MGTTPVQSSRRPRGGKLNSLSVKAVKFSAFSDAGILATATPILIDCVSVNAYIEIAIMRVRNCVLGKIALLLQLIS